MIVPDFRLEQEKNHVIVLIRLPYVKISSAQFYIDGHLFEFYLKPYLLSLTFKQLLAPQNEPVKAIYYYQKHLLKIILLKLKPDEHFQDLGLLQKLLSSAPKSSKPKTLVEIVGPSEIITEQAVGGCLYGYGFCSNYTNVFANFKEQLLQIFEFDPCEVAICQRQKISQKITLADFDECSYFYDKYENEEIEYLLKSTEAAKHLKQITQSNQTDFANKLPKKGLIINKESHMELEKQIESLLLCYAYELVCLDGDLSIESARTINKTCGVLRCFLNYQNMSLQEVTYDCLKRCLTYSLYKHLQVAEKALKLIRTMDYRTLLGVLYELRGLFQECESKHLLNRIYMDDFVIYAIDKQTKFQASLLKQLPNLKFDAGRLEKELLNIHSVATSKQVLNTMLTNVKPTLELN